MAGVLGSVTVVDQVANVTLLVPEPDHWHVSPKDAAVEVIAYSTFSEQSVVRPRARGGRSRLRPPEAMHSRPAKPGYCGSGLPASVLHRFRKLVHTEALIDVDHELSVLRMRKSPSEIAALRRSIELTDARFCQSTSTSVPMPRSARWLGAIWHVPVRASYTAVRQARSSDER
jgi:hypothetical protein